MPEDRRDIPPRLREDDSIEVQLRRWLRVSGAADDLPPEDPPEPPELPEGPKDPGQGGGGNDPAQPGQNDWEWYDQSPIIPHVVANAVRTQRFSQLNFRLLFHHYLPATRGRPEGREVAGQSQALLNSLCQGANAYYNDQADLIAAIREQAITAVRDYCAPWGWTELTIDLNSTMIVGMGLHSQFENGLSLHHLTGTPYIPSSALKGIARAFALQELAEAFGIPWVERESTDPHPTPYTHFAELLSWVPPMDERSSAQRKAARAQLAERLRMLHAATDEVEGAQLRLPNDPNECFAWESLAGGQGPDKRIVWFRLGFGTANEQGGRGVVLFSDAVPDTSTHPLTLEPGLLNPHISPRGEQEWVNPIPIGFLTVAVGARFTAALGSLHPDQDALRAQLLRWLSDGARNLGIGARTSTGHGSATITGQDHPAGP